MAMYKLEDVTFYVEDGKLKVKKDNKVLESGTQISFETDFDYSKYLDLYNSYMLSDYKASKEKINAACYAMCCEVFPWGSKILTKNLYFRNSFDKMKAIAKLVVMV